MKKTSENQQSEQFYTYRGISKCLSAGISFLTDNFLYLIKISLPIAILYSIINGALAYFLSDTHISQSLYTIVGGANTSGLGVVISFLLLCLLSYASTCFMLGLLYRLMCIHSHDIPLDKDNMLSTLKFSAKYGVKAFCFYLIPLFIVLAFSTVSHYALMKNIANGAVFPWLTLGIVILIVIALLVFALPLSIALPAMYLEKGNAFKNCLYGYKKGIKSWGKVFCLSLLLVMLVGLIDFVLLMPALSMISCYHAATDSILNGDAVTMPSGFHFWYAIVLFVSYFILFFVSWVSHTPFCYLYASIKSDELEEAKNQYKI